MLKGVLYALDVIFKVRWIKLGLALVTFAQKGKVGKKLTKIIN